MWPEIKILAFTLTFTYITTSRHGMKNANIGLQKVKVSRLFHKNGSQN